MENNDDKPAILRAIEIIIANPEDIKEQALQIKKSTIRNMDPGRVKRK